MILITWVKLMLNRVELLLNYFELDLEIMHFLEGIYGIDNNLQFPPLWKVSWPSPIPLSFHKPSSLCCKKTLWPWLFWSFWSPCSLPENVPTASRLVTIRKLFHKHWFHSKRLCPHLRTRPLATWLWQCETKLPSDNFFILKSLKSLEAKRSNYTSIDPKQQQTMFPRRSCAIKKSLVAVFLRKETKEQGETRPGTEPGTRMNQKIMIEHNPLPEKGKKSRETSQGTRAGTRRKEEIMMEDNATILGRQAPQRF